MPAQKTDVPAAFKLLQVELFVPVDTVIAEIVKQDPSNSALVRTVLDNEDGAFYGNALPVRGRTDISNNSFLLEVLHPEIGRESLDALPEVKSVKILTL